MAGAIEQLAVAFPAASRGRTPAQLSAIYFMALQDLPEDAVTGAVLVLLRDSRFFPKPVEWREEAEAWWKRNRAPQPTHFDPLVCSVCGAVAREGAPSVVPKRQPVGFPGFGKIIPGEFETRMCGRLEIHHHAPSHRLAEIAKPT